jgi:hypothetical protein
VIVQAFQDQLLAAFPEPTWEPLVRGLRAGIALGDGLMETSPILRTEIGSDLRGFVRRAGILFHMQELCRAGILPFSAEATKMPLGSWHWLDIRSGNFLAHVARTESAGALPENSKSRQAKCFKNEYDLFSDGRIPEIEDVLGSTTERYSVVTFGTDRTGTLLHAAIGMPDVEYQQWLAFINIGKRFRQVAHEVPIAPKTPDPAESLRFREDVEQMMADRDKSPGAEKLV